MPGPYVSSSWSGVAMIPGFSEETTRLISLCHVVSWRTDLNHQSHRGCAGPSPMLTIVLRPFVPDF